MHRDINFTFELETPRRSQPTKNCLFKH